MYQHKSFFKKPEDYIGWLEWDKFHKDLKDDFLYTYRPGYGFLPLREYLLDCKNFLWKRDKKNV